MMLAAQLTVGVEDTLRLGVLRTLKKRRDESVFECVVRLACLGPNLLVPRLRERRRLERMVGPAGIGLWEALQRYQFRCLRGLGLAPEHRLLDIGCGPLQGGLAFIEYLNPGGYVGVDLRADAIAEARAQITANGLAEKKPEVYRSDTFGRNELGSRKFDFFWISQLLYHLDDEQVEALLEEFVARSEKGGRLIGDFVAAEGEPRRGNEMWQEFFFYYRSFGFYEDLARRHGLRLVRHGQIAQHGYPTRWTYNLSRNELIEFRRQKPGAFESGAA